MSDLDVQRTSLWSLLLFAIFTFHLVLAEPGLEPANLGSLVYRSTTLPSATLQCSVCICIRVCVCVSGCVCYVCICTHR
jgi:hypothetical protein